MTPSRRSDDVDPLCYDSQNILMHLRKITIVTPAFSASASRGAPNRRTQRGEHALPAPVSLKKVLNASSSLRDWNLWATSFHRVEVSVSDLSWTLSSVLSDAPVCVLHLNACTQVWLLRCWSKMRRHTFFYFVRDNFSQPQSSSSLPSIVLFSEHEMDREKRCFLYGPTSPYLIHTGTHMTNVTGFFAFSYLVFFLVPQTLTTSCSL